MEAMNNDEKRVKVRVCDVEREIAATRSMAIKAKCMDCSGGEAAEVRNCLCTDCPLYPYRGVIIFDKKEMSDEQKEAARERMRVMWGKRVNSDK